MDLPNVYYVLFPEIDQWVKLANWDYSHVKIRRVDWERKVFRARFLVPPKCIIHNYPEVNEQEWISFERIETTLRKFWEPVLIAAYEEALAKQSGVTIKQT